MDKELSLAEWKKMIPTSLRSDPLWKSNYYQKAMYLYDLAWLDCKLLKQDHRSRPIINQLLRSAASVCANMEEAYGRGVGTRDYVRVLRISLGGARETKGHYLRSRHVLPSELLKKRLQVIDQIIVKLVGTIAKHRNNLSHS